MSRLYFLRFDHWPRPVSNRFVHARPNPCVHACLRVCLCVMGATARDFVLCRPDSPPEPCKMCAVLVGLALFVQPLSARASFDSQFFALVTAIKFSPISRISLFHFITCVKASVLSHYSKRKRFFSKVN